MSFGTKKTVKSAIAALSKAIKDLEEVATQASAVISKQTKVILDAEGTRAEAAKERDKAKEIAKKIGDLIS